MSIKNKKHDLTALVKTSIHGGIPFIMGDPGKGKTAVLQSIAEDNDWQYIDIRLAQKDESDVGGLPKLFERDYDGKKVWTMDYCVPSWAINANTKPTLVVFEELNRAPLAVRNAALQIFNERRIGENFHFNKNVYFASTGNKGSADNTEVEEFDGALWNRVFKYDYDLTINEWVEGFAKKNVHPDIVSFVKANPDYFYRPATDVETVFASPRSWTFLSNLITEMHGKNAPSEKYLDDIQRLGVCFVGNSILKFIRYVQDTMQIRIEDIINNWSNVKEQVAKLNRDRISEFVSNLSSTNVLELADEKVENVVEFLKTIDADEAVSYIKNSVLTKTISASEVETNKKLRMIIQPFKKSILRMADSTIK